MGEWLSNAGRKPNENEDADLAADAGDRLAESRVTRLDESFLDGEGLAAAIKRISKIELALADAIRDVLNTDAPDVRKLLNRLDAWTKMLEAMRKLEKDTPGILEQHKKQIDIGEVEEGVTRLLLAIVGRLSILPTRGMQTLAGFTDPQDIREELEKEIAEALTPIRECEWIPQEHRDKLAAAAAEVSARSTSSLPALRKPKRQKQRRAK